MYFSACLKGRSLHLSHAASIKPDAYILPLSWMRDGDVGGQRHDKVYDAGNVDILPKWQEKESLEDYLKVYTPTLPVSKDKTSDKGCVFVMFTVKADGKVTDASVAHSVRADLDAAALQLVRGMPAWAPAKYRGKSVACRYVVRIDSWR